MNRLDLSDTSNRIFGKMLKAQATNAGDTVFLKTDAVSHTFAEVEHITNVIAAGLKELGVGAGDRVVLLLGNRPEMVLLALAINKLGAIWIPVNTDYKGEWLKDTLQRCRARLLVTEQAFQDRIAAISDGTGISQAVVLDDDGDICLANATSYASLLEHQPLEPDYAEQDYGDTCAILWTSGTTGKSKGVMQSYNGWIHAILYGCCIQYDTQDGDIIYCVLPLFNTGAWITSIFRALIEGVTVVIEDKFSVSSFWERVNHFGATQTFAIGAMGVFLMDAPEQADEADNPMRVAQIVPMPPNLWQAFEKRFGLRLVRSGLGQSECQMIATQFEDRDDVPVYAAGFAHESTELQLQDDEGNEVPDGEAGEIAIKTKLPHILFNGYFDNPEATEGAYRNGWYLTGDMGRKDPQTGALFFVDRKRDALRFAGRNISTLEVESVVRRHPAVKDVAAFGIPSEQLESEHELKLNIILADGVSPSPEELCQFINDNAPHYFVPRYMEFVTELPYTPTNKLQKFKLREQGVTAQTWDLKQSSYKVQR